MHDAHRVLRAALAVALIATAALFALATHLEQTQAKHHTEAVTAPGGPASAPPSVGDGDHGEPAAAKPAAGSVAPPERAGGLGGEATEKVLGVKVESTAAIVVGVGLSLLFAALVVAVPRRSVLLMVAAFGLAFVALDVREVAHQSHEARRGLEALAAVLAASHLAIAAAAVAVWSRSPVGRVSTDAAAG